VRYAIARRAVAVLANAPDHFSKMFVKQIPLAGEATGTAIDPIMMKLTLRDEESQERTTTD
jgi:hypothetical protein